jgi:drug/metabolite transporter (DMT)-like permease
MLHEIGHVPAGLMGAISFGAGDFAGSRATLRLSGLSAVAVAQLVAAATSVAVLAVVGGSVPHGSQGQLAALAGACHVTAVFFLYQGMAHGRVSVVAPVAGVVGIGVPVVADFGFIEMASPVHCAGIALAVVAIFLFSQSSMDGEDRTKTSYSIRTGVISGMGYGFADLFLGLMTTETAEGGLAVARMTGASLAIGLLLALWLATRRREPLEIVALTSTMEHETRLVPWGANLRTGLLLCALAGFLDCLGQLGYVLSATQGQISVAAALVAMYPAVAVGLAVWLLKERIGPTQWGGLAATFAGIGLLAQ